MSFQELAPKLGIDDILAARADALKKFSDAMNALIDVNVTMRKAGFGEYVMTRTLTRNSYYSLNSENSGGPLVEQFKKNLDKDLWKYLGDATGLTQIMDTQALDEWREGIERNPPECTKETLTSTFENLSYQRSLIFNRGLVNAFKRLSGKYKTNDAFKIGKKVIVSHCLGNWAHGLDSLNDVERVLFVLDSIKPPEHMHSIKRKIQSGGDVETDYMSIKTYQNGNAHVTFKRQDLTDKANKIITAFYGETIPNDSHRT